MSGMSKMPTVGVRTGLPANNRGRSFQDNLRAFDRSGVMPKIRDRMWDMAARANELRGVHGDDYAYEEKVGGWPVVLQQNRKMNLMFMSIPLGRIDEHRIGALTEDLSQRIYGTILDLDVENTRPHCDVTFKLLLGAKLLVRDSFHSFVGELIAMGNECDASMSVKSVDVAQSRNNPRVSRLCLDDWVNIYPGFPPSFSLQQELDGLTRIWEMGRDRWGQSFVAHKVRPWKWTAKHDAIHAHLLKISGAKRIDAYSLRKLFR